MKIDLHTHILPDPDRWPDWAARAGYPGWVALERSGACGARMVIDGRAFRDVASNCWDPLERVREADSCGVVTQVLSTVPAMFSYWARARDALDVSRWLNDHVAGVVASSAGVDVPGLARGEDPGAGHGAGLRRFVGLGTIPMQDPALAIRELERCVRELGLAGVQIGTNVNGVNLDDPGVVEVLAAAERLGACVFVHPWEMVRQGTHGTRALATERVVDRMDKYWLPWLVGMPAETCLAMASVIFGGVLDRLPGLRIAFAHGGGSFAGTIGRLAHGHACRPDIVAVRNPRSPREYVASRGRGGAYLPERPARFWVDSLVHDAAALRLVLGLFGAPRVALGSDYPFPLGEDAPGALVESMRGELGDEVVGWVLWRSALGFLYGR